MQVKAIFRLIRVPQWIKNSFVLVPLIFSQHVFETEYLLPALLAVITFCFVSSSVYVINDIVDREQDRLHPKKKNRPVASGAVSVPQAIGLVIVLVIIIALISPSLGTRFILSITAFFILNTVYSFYSKHVVLLDIFSIAAGFMLRVVAGAFAIQVAISSWLILTTMFLSLFLAVMKRRSEIVLMTDNGKGSTRKVLESYTISFTDQMATISAAAVIICYALYTTAERTVEGFHTDKLIYTTPFVVFGIFRYMHLEYLHDQGENTTEIMMHDVPMIVTILLYLTFIITLIYWY
ncbi:MAG: decaprenyl-phosphate phosphoribosyltransferase [Ignavibacteriales bacterium]|nr:decaprenyl-phosphate phosphoribosyltransferase [Ignavibacteriales bacterium]